MPGGCTDDDYCTILEELLLPIAAQFAPDLVLVSSGFDALKQDPTGSVQTRSHASHTCLTPAGFGKMTQMLMPLAGGRLVLALEGGYDHDWTARAATECVRALLGLPLLGQPEYVPGPHVELPQVINNVKDQLRGSWVFK